MEARERARARPSAIRSTSPRRPSLVSFPGSHGGGARSKYIAAAADDDNDVVDGHGGNSRIAAVARAGKRKVYTTLAAGCVLCVGRRQGRIKSAAKEREL